MWIFVNLVLSIFLCFHHLYALLFIFHFQKSETSRSVHLWQEGQRVRWAVPASPQEKSCTFTKQLLAFPHCMCFQMSIHPRRSYAPSHRQSDLNFFFCLITFSSPSNWSSGTVIRILHWGQLGYSTPWHHLTHPPTCKLYTCNSDQMKDLWHLILFEVNTGHAHVHCTRLFVTAP